MYIFVRPLNQPLEHIRRILHLLLLAAILHGCGEDAAFEKHITEGIIEYDVTYPELEEDNLMLEMLPDEMIMTFKEDKFKSELKTGAGIVEMSLIADGEKRQLNNMVKLFSDRYVLKLNESETQEFVDVLPPFRMEFLDGTDTIADALCKRILIDFGQAKTESYIFAFTDEIALKSPNWCTPYRDIEGVLLDYRIDNYGMVMRLKARKIIPKDIPDEAFVVDDRYQELTRKEFDELVVENMKIFME